MDFKNTQLGEIIRSHPKSEASQEQYAYQSWPLDQLAMHIQKRHHQYVEKAIPIIIGYLNIIVQAHADVHPELLKIQSIFEKTAGELTMHMKKEELMVFPYVKKLVRLKNENITDWKNPVYGKVENPIRQMLEEHDAEEKRMKEIAQLSHQYSPPKDGCSSFVIAYQKLREFEEDLSLHIYLENDILFPKAIALEQSLREIQQKN